MNSTRSSRGIALAALLFVSVVAVGTAAAMSVGVDDAPGASQVGSEASATVTVEDPFTETNEWTLRGRTQLESVSWTVTVLQQGNQLSQHTYGNESFEQQLSLDNGGDELVVEISGTTPDVANYSYDPAQEYTVASLVQVQGSNPTVLRNVTAEYYTTRSRDAREAIDAADEAINAAGGNAQAEDLRDSAVSAYDVGNFDNAISLAEQSQNAARKAQQSHQTMQMVLYGVGVLIGLVVVGGGVYYWRSQQDDNQRLR
ncbi:MAG: hypothetical protein ABEI96_10200 [Haloarculaceae archaeon]